MVENQEPLIHERTSAERTSAHQAAYQDALEALTDEDGDGVPLAGGDCDDQDADRYPGATEIWYDGADQDCAGDDDDDADGDGDRPEDLGGTDCDDADATISGQGAEGWEDAGIDNDCDGSVEDQIRVSLSDVAQAIPGAAAGDALGSDLRAVPAGWIDDEAVLLASSPLGADGGVAYGWPASDLIENASIGTASWTIEAAAVGDYLGFGLGWAGDEVEPITFVSAEGVDAGRGAVYAWAPEDWGAAPTFTLVGTIEGAYLGLKAVSGHDHDGDGIADLVVAAPLDSSLANSAGSVYILLDPPSYEGNVSAADADVRIMTTYADALLSPQLVGDLDDDGLDDLGLTQNVSADDGPGAFLLTGAREGGEVDAESVALASVIGGPMIFGKITDAGSDGTYYLTGASGGMMRFELPLSGTITPWEDAVDTLPFADAGDFYSVLRTDVPGYADHARIMSTSTSYQNRTGFLSIGLPTWPEGELADDAQFLALGDAPADGAGASLDLLDLEGDGLLDIVVGAPDADPGGSGSGAIYLVPAPR